MLTLLLLFPLAKENLLVYRAIREGAQERGDNLLLLAAALPLVACGHEERRARGTFIDGRREGAVGDRNGRVYVNTDGDVPRRPRG